jgi:hypothetical protein
MANFDWQAQKSWFIPAPYRSYPHITLVVYDKDLTLEIAMRMANEGMTIP